MNEQTARLKTALSNRYEIDREIGSGGMATVYVAHDQKHHRKVAIKVLRPELAARVGAERFLQEIKVTANLQHPHILPLHDSGRTGGADDFLYYVMPFVEGESLRDKLDRERQLSIHEAVEITKGVANALDYAHRQGVIHRDIKPENILLQDGQPVLADFGIALAVSAAGGERLTDTGLSVGTPHYMSPEQATGERQLDGRSDIYSLGAVLYEMLTGEPPHPGATAQAVVARILSEQPTPVRKLRDAVPEGLDSAIRKALSRTPADRFRTAAEFSVAVADGERNDTGRPASIRMPRRWTRIALVVAAIALVTSAVILVRGSQTPALRSVAVLPLENVSGDSTEAYFVDGVHDALINELSQISAFERVTGRRSVMRFADSRQSLQEIAGALNVDALIEGSVLRVADAVRINVQLIRASPERNLWSSSYENRLEDVLALQRRVTTDIAREIALTLTPGEAARLADARSIDPAAFDLYQRGRFHWNKRTERGFRLAIESFNEAIALDSTYAEAYAGLSDAYNLLAQYSHIPLEEGIPLARGAAELAVLSDSTLADAHTSLAEVHFLDREWDKAESAYRRAIALNPSYATGHHFFGWFLSYIGRHEEAVSALERARELDPFVAIINTDLAATYFLARRYDEARMQVQRTLELDPGFRRALSIQHGLHIIDGNTPEAVRIGEQLGEWWAGRLYVAHALGAGGRSSEARPIVRDQLALWGSMENADPFRAAYVATVYAALGDRDSTLVWLEYAVNQGLSAGPISLKVWPFFDPLRSDPRFQALIDQMRFPDY